MANRKQCKCGASIPLNKKYCSECEEIIEDYKSNRDRDNKKTKSRKKYMGEE